MLQRASYFVGACRCSRRSRTSRTATTRRRCRVATPVTRTRTTCARRSARRSRFELSPLASRDHTLTRLVRLQLRIAERNSWFEEGIKLDEEARARRVKLDDAKKKKLDQLRFVLVTSLCHDHSRNLNPSEFESTRNLLVAFVATCSFLPPYSPLSLLSSTQTFKPTSTPFIRTGCELTRTRCINSKF